MGKGIKMLKYGVEHWLFIYFIFCVYGWVQESTIESLYHKKLINRGFLKGPYIPIYGFGGLAMLFFCMPFKSNGFFVFLAGVVSCTILEYFTGWIMETCFGVQFWDYSMLKFTYKNRISLISSLFWGFLGLYMVYFLYGIVNSFISAIPNNYIIVINTIFLISMSLDFFLRVKKKIRVDNITSTLSTGFEHFGTYFQKPLEFIDRVRGINTRDDEEDGNDDDQSYF